MGCDIKPAIRSAALLVVGLCAIAGCARNTPPAWRTHGAEEDALKREVVLMSDDLRIMDRGSPNYRKVEAGRDRLLAQLGAEAVRWGLPGDLEVVDHADGDHATLVNRSRDLIGLSFGLGERPAARSRGPVARTGRPGDLPAGVLPRPGEGRRVRRGCDVCYGPALDYDKLRGLPACERLRWE